MCVSATVLPNGSVVSSSNGESGTVRRINRRYKSNRMAAWKASARLGKAKILQVKTKVGKKLSMPHERFEPEYSQFVQLERLEVD